MTETPHTNDPENRPDIYALLHRDMGKYDAYRYARRIEEALGWEQPVRQDHGVSAAFLAWSAERDENLPQSFAAFVCDVLRMADFRGDLPSEWP